MRSNKTLTLVSSESQLATILSSPMAAPPTIPKQLKEDAIANLKRYKHSHQSAEDRSLRSDISIKWWLFPPSPKSPVVPSIFTGMEMGLGEYMGRIRFKYDGQECSLSNSRFSSLIPDNIDSITDMWSDALFILLVENESLYFDLERVQFFNLIPCIIVKSMDDEPSIANGLFLKKMHTDFKIPVLALTDWNPKAFNFLAFYGRGSEDAYGSSAKKLDTPDIKWLGLKFSDYDKYRVTKNFMSRMTKKDVNMATDMLETPLLKKNLAWADELKLMLKERKKDQLEVYSVEDWKMRFLIFHVLPDKLREQCWSYENNAWS